MDQRFVYKRGLRPHTDYTWLHPAEIPEGAVDCTDMDDAEFDAFVRSRQEPTSTDPAPDSGQKSDAGNFAGSR